MNKSKYLITIGYIEIVISAIAIIFLFVQAIYVTNGWFLFGYLENNVFSIIFSWVFVVIGLFFFPALGTLLITVGHMCDNEEEIDKLKIDIAKLKQKIANIEGPSSDLVKKQNDEKAKADNVSLDDLVVFNSDYEIDGVVVKKGTKAFVDRIIEYNDRKIYAVIIEKTGRVVKVDGEFISIYETKKT